MDYKGDLRPTSPTNRKRNIISLNLNSATISPSGPIGGAFIIFYFALIENGVNLNLSRRWDLNIDFAYIPKIMALNMNN